MPMRRAQLFILTAITALFAVFGSFTVDAQFVTPATKAAGGEIEGFAINRLARIAPAMRAEIEKGTFAGAVTLIARRGTIVHYEAHGSLDAAKTKPMPKNAVFRLASMTKPLTSVATMMLVEQGKLKLGDMVETYLPELKDMKVEATKTGADGKVVIEDLPVTRPMTIQDLLRHTSGLVYGAAASARIKKAYEEANIEAREADISASDMLKRLGQIPLANQPGTTFLYSISTDVLGLVLERVTKKSLDKVFDEMLLQPLAMTDTAFWVPETKRNRLAETLDSDAQKAPMLAAYRQFAPPSEANYLKGGAGLVGTGTDYLKFLQMLANGGEYQGKRYLSRKTVDFMLSDHTIGFAGTPFASTGPGYGFGLGFAVRQGDGMGWTPGSKGDAMWAGAWGTSFWIDPKEQLVGILMSQGPSTRVHSRMLFKNLVYGALVR